MKDGFPLVGGCRFGGGVSPGALQESISILVSIYINVLGRYLSTDLPSNMDGWISCFHDLLAVMIITNNLG